ncbi:hypothetical protein [Ruegeria sp. HKCCA5426]|uniref:hypothetical protein n=1 Tax=Ruegeria sp. HKCCA5426 TaxID=2682985 RepID=UPI001489D698|nr:hypothetical protein [Ruegeria sp. HKCCA5426]
MLDETPLAEQHASHETYEQSQTSRFTVLRALGGKKSVKIFSNKGVQPYDKAAWFEPKDIEINDFESLVSVLSELESFDNRIIVTGRVAEPYQGKSKIPRRKNPRNGQPASLEDVGSHIAMFDCDNLSVPAGHGWHDTAGLAKATWNILTDRVAALKGANVFWQASASAGQPNLADKAKFHFWVLLDEPLSEGQKRTLYGLAGTDKSLACPIQPHYIGRPTFVGVTDPLGGQPRSGRIIGVSDSVRVKDLGLEAVEPVKSEHRVSNLDRRARASSTPRHQTTGSTWAERQLNTACDIILSADERNTEINKRAFFIGGAVAKGLLDEQTAFERLHHAAAATGHDRFEEALNNGFRDGLKHPLKWNDKPEPPQNLGAYYPPASECRASAVEGSRAAINTWADKSINYLANKGPAAPPREMVWGMQGGGKTGTLVGREDPSDGNSEARTKPETSPGALHRTTGLVSVMYLPTHTKCEEAAETYRKCAPEGAPPCIVIRGRGQPDPENKTGQNMCLLSDLADRLANQGVTVRSTLCVKCPLKDDCGYLRQERLVEKLIQDGLGLVIFAPHSYAYLPLPAETQSDQAIFDESPGSTIIEKLQLSIVDLLSPLEFGGTAFPVSEKRKNDMAADAIADAKQLVEPALKVIAAAYHPEHGLSLDHLRSNGVDATKLKSVLAVLDAYRDKRVPILIGGKLSALDNSAPVEQIQRTARKIARTFSSKSGPRFDHLRVFLEVLKAEMETGLSWPNAIAATHPSSGILTVVRLRPLTHAADKPFLFLDGTGDPDLAKIMFGDDLRAHRFAAERNALVTQVVKNQMSSRNILGKQSDNELIEDSIPPKCALLQDRIKGVLDRHSDAAVFLTKRIRKALGLLDDARAGHFNAIRGLNHWEGRPTAIIVGREQAPMQEIELTARAFAAKLRRPLVSSGPVWEWRGIRTRDEASSYPIVVMTHPDPLVEKILHQTREAEIAQAIDRIRLIHNREPKEVIIMNEIAVDITVDQVVGWPDFWPGGTRPERAVQMSGFLPLDGQEAVNLFPEIWNNKETSNKDLKPLRSLVSENVYKDLLYAKPDSKAVCHVRYKRHIPESQRTHWRAGLVYSPRAEAKGLVEKVTGELLEFEVLSENSLRDNSED